MTSESEELLSKRIKQGKSARHQILFNKEQIDEALGLGFKKIDVWRTLNDEGKFTRTYNSFLEAYNKLENIRRSPKKKETEKPEPTKVDQKPVEAENKKNKPFVKKDKFIHDAKPNPDELI